MHRFRVDLGLNDPADLGRVEKAVRSIDPGAKIFEVHAQSSAPPPKPINEDCDYVEDLTD